MRTYREASGDGHNLAAEWEIVPVQNISAGDFVFAENGKEPGTVVGVFINQDSKMAHYLIEDGDGKLYQWGAEFGKAVWRKLVG